MTPEQYARLATLFARLDSMDAGRRTRALARIEASEDAPLRADLERLLGFATEDDARVRASIERAAGAWARESESKSLANPSHIGPFEIVRRIADGGMGTVFEAKQTEPERRVALKIVRGGLVDAESSARFARETRALARLQHAGIATLYDAGTAETDLGALPWIAMELVDGVPITTFVREQHLDVATTLRLLAATADAVHHAHRKGVIHRDLKPGNVLVDRAGNPRILDFGVARLVLGSEDAALTRTGQVVGTPRYMSPEQLRGETADTASDVYALGVIAFETLAGRPPYDIGTASTADALREIMSTPLPRLRLLRADVGLDVETIVRHALEQRPDDRYPSADAFAEDLRRALRHEPIEARPPTVGYLFRCFARRHRTLVVASVAAALALLVGVAGILLFAAREAEQRATADAHARRSQTDAARTHLLAAALAIDAGDGGGARAQLEAVRPEDRGWAWAHLAARTVDGEQIVGADEEVHGWLVDAALVDGRLITLHDGRTDEDAPRVRVRDAETGAAQAQFPLSPGLVKRLSPSGRRIASLDAGRVTIQFLPSEAEPHAITCGAGTVRFLGRFGPDDTRIALGLGPEERPAIALFNAASGERLGYWATPEPTSHAVPLDAGRVLGAGPKGALYVGKPGSAFVRRTAPLGAAIQSLAVINAGERAITCDERDRLVLHDLGAGHILRRWQGRTGSGGLVSTTDDGRWILLHGGDALLRVFEPQTLALVARFQVRSRAPAVRPPWSVDGVCYVATRDGQVEAFELGRIEAPTDVLRGHVGAVTRLAFAPDGRRLASAGTDGFIRLWDVGTQRVLGVIDLGLQPLPDGRRVIEGLQFSTDGTKLAAAVLSGRLPARRRVRSFDARTGDEIPGPYPGKPPSRSPTYAVAVGTGGDGAAVRDEREIDVRDATGRHILTLRGHRAPIEDLAYTPNQRVLASADARGIIRLWSPSAPAARMRLRHAALGVPPDRFAAWKRQVEVGTLDAAWASLDGWPPEERTAAWTWLLARRLPAREVEQGQVTRRMERPVTLETPGAAPRRVLAYAASSAPGELVSEQALVAHLKLGGFTLPPTKVPPQKAVLLLKPEPEGAPDRLRARLVVKSFTQASHPMMRRMGASAPPDGLDSAELGVWWSPHGRTGELSMPAGREHAGEVLDHVGNLLDGLLVPLPSEPIGIGARWWVESRAVALGVEVITRSTYELTERDGRIAHLRVRVVKRAAAQAIDAPTSAKQIEMRLTSMEGASQGQAVISEDLPAPVSIHLDTSQTLGAVMTRGKVTQAIEIVVKGTQDSSFRVK